MSCPDLYLQPRFLLRPFRKRPGQPCIIPACRYSQNLTHKWHWILESQFFHHRVPGRDSLAKYAAAFFNMSRSILTSASSRFTRANSTSISVRGRCDLPILPSLPALDALTQFPIVEGGNDNHRPASGNVSPPSVTSFTASSRNSFVYVPFGILFISTPPFSILLKLWCLRYPSYLTFFSDKLSLNLTRSLANIVIQEFY